jgi:hypothetical protein
VSGDATQDEEVGQKRKLLKEVGFRSPVSEGDILVSRFWKPGGLHHGLGQRGDGDDLEMAELVSRYIMPSS